MRQYAFNILIIVSLCCGLGAMKHDENPQFTVDSLFHKNTGSQEKHDTLVSVFTHMKQEGTLTPTFFLHLLNEHGTEQFLFSALHDTDVILAQAIYCDILVNSRSLDREVRRTIAFRFGQLTQESHNDQLFYALHNEQNLEVAVLVGQAFVKSRRVELEPLAISWAIALRNQEFSQRNHELERSLHALLFEIGTPAALSEILRNLERGGGTTAYLIEGIKYLGDAKFLPAYTYCKQKAEDEEEDCPVRVEALQAMIKMYSDTKRAEILKVAESIRASNSFYPSYSEMLDQIILQLKGR